MSKHPSRKYIEFIALCLLAVGLLWWFGRKLNWTEVRTAVSHANPTLLVAAAIIVCFSYLCRALRWGAFLKPLGPARLRDLFAATTIGFGAMFLIGRAGEVVRPVVLPMRDPRVRPSASFVTIMVERIYDMIAVVLMFSINLGWFKPTTTLGNEFARVRIVGIVLLMCAVLGLVLLTWFRTKSPAVIVYFNRLFERWHFIPKRLSRLFIGLLEQLAQALRVLVNARELAETIGWTVLLWAAITVANMLVIRAFGIHFGISETIFVLGWALVGSLVPTPGGAAGAFHAATAAGLLFLGIDRELAAAVSILMHAIDFGPAVLFGFAYAIRGDLNLSRLRALTSSEAVEHVVEEETLVPESTSNNSQPLEQTSGD